MAKASAAKPVFGTGVLSGLRQAAGTGGGEPLTLLLDQIDEDPNQPRKVFSDAELDQMAETIKLLGVLSPIGVRKGAGDRYALVYGARRLRGSRLAGKTRIPAIILTAEQATLAAQIIENQSRAALANSDLAAAVNQLFKDGMTVKQIAVVCNLKEYQVAAFRAVEKLPAFLRSRLDHADIRALYDLSRAWDKHPEAVESGMPAEDVYLTITEARRVIEAVTGKWTGGIVPSGKQDVPGVATTPPPVEPASSVKVPSREPTKAVAPDGPALPLVLDGPEQPTPPPEMPEASERIEGPLPAPEPTRPGPPVQDTKTAPEFLMETADGEQGTLLTSRRSEKPGYAFVRIGTQIVETPFLELRCINVL